MPVIQHLVHHWRKIMWAAAAVLVIWLLGLPLVRQLGLVRETVTLDSRVPGASAQPRTYEIVTVLGKDAIPAILEPRFKQAEAATGMRDGELVIGVSIDGDHRAYPISLLSRHEIVNDTVGGTPVAVTR